MSSAVRTRPPGVDDLLQDYLKVINEKDTEILELVAKTQGLETELRKTEERARTRIKSLKESAGELQTEAEAAARRLHEAENIVSTLQRERDELRSDVETLRDAMYRQDHDLRSALKASEKAQKADASAVQELNVELEAKKRETSEQVGNLENRLNTTTRQLRDSDDERNRLLKECAALQSRLEDRENQLREMKRLRKTLVPRDEVASEMRAVEARANAEVSGATRELERLRAEYTEEQHRGQRRDQMLGESREEVRRYEQTISEQRRTINENEMKAAQQAVSHAQRIDEMRADLAVAHDKISSLDQNKQQTESDFAQLKMRHEENKRMAQNNETSLRAELERIRDKNLEQTSEMESLKRVIAQQDSMIQQARDRAERIAEERADEVRALRDDVNRFSVAAQSSAATAQNNEKIISQLRDEMRREHETRVAAEKHGRELESNLNQTRHQCDLNASEVNTAANTIAELRREREETAIRCGRAETAHQEAMGEVRTLKNENERIKGDVMRLEGQTSTERAERNRLEGRCNADQLTIQRLNNELQDRDTRVSVLESNVTTLDAQKTAGAEEVARLRSHLEQVSNDTRREIQQDRDTIRRLQNETEDLSSRLSSAELQKDELSKEVTDRRSKELQLDALLQSRNHELTAASERAENSETLRQQLNTQNTALQKQSSELQQRVDELRQAYSNLQSQFDKQQEQLGAAVRAREHESFLLSNRSAASGNTPSNNNNNNVSSSNQNNNVNANTAATAASGGGGGNHNNMNISGVSGVNNSTAAPSPSRNLGSGEGPLPARGPTMYTASYRPGPFSPGQYSAVLASGASPSSAHTPGGLVGSRVPQQPNSQSIHVSPSRRGYSSAASPQPRY